MSGLNIFFTVSGLERIKISGFVTDFVAGNIDGRDAVSKNSRIRRK